jgi:predicted enzyme involved in methoxymalonyl-ACP biosynthesis
VCWLKSRRRALQGPRIAALVETVQLRAPTIIFNDDSPSNLEEVRHYVPCVQTAPETFIPEIADHPLFQGKDDRALKRLGQHKLLERRKSDQAAAGTDVTRFLCESEIRVGFEYDLEGNLDRVIALINRTNQLNFTKVQLPEDSEPARAALRRLLSRYLTQGALVEVPDRYGNHGYCGPYNLQRVAVAEPFLLLVSDSRHGCGALAL